MPNKLKGIINFVTKNADIFYQNLHSYIKAERMEDPKFVQNVFRNLPKVYMQKLH